jgi:formate hydrogenlyase subunit 4
MTRYLILLAGGVILIALAGPLVWSVFLSENHDFVIGVTAFSVGVVTFFGIIGLSRSSQKQQMPPAGSLRTAIACSIVISYLFIVCFTTFVKTSDQTGGVTDWFMRSFSNVMSLTIAFYFGASAATQIFDKRKKEKEEEPLNSEAKAKQE